MIEYEIRFSLPDNIASIFDDTKRLEYMQKQVGEFMGNLIVNEVTDVADRVAHRITPVIRRVENDA
jgi:hypothetical protein